jgi:hypothetical protein
MDKKKCFKCGEIKELSLFYKHPGMKDGHLNKCIECSIKYFHEYFDIMSNNPEWIEKEKERSKEKYHRLGYKENQKEWNKKRPWTKISIYSNLSRDLKRDGIIKKGDIIHHWNYNDRYLKDVFIISSILHRKLHKYLIPKGKLFIYDGFLLRTKEQHYNVIQEIMRIENINGEILSLIKL